MQTSAAYAVRPWESADTFTFRIDRMDTRHSDICKLILFVAVDIK